jgi:hypothetical protein
MNFTSPHRHRRQAHAMSGVRGEGGYLINAQASVSWNAAACHDLANVDGSVAPFSPRREDGLRPKRRSCPSRLIIDAGHTKKRSLRIRDMCSSLLRLDPIEAPIRSTQRRTTPCGRHQFNRYTCSGAAGPEEPVAGLYAGE